MSASRIAAIRARLEAATKGPCLASTMPYPHACVSCDLGCREEKVAKASLRAHAPEDLAWLLGEHEAAMRALGEGWQVTPRLADRAQMTREAADHWKAMLQERVKERDHFAVTASDALSDLRSEEDEHQRTRSRLEAVEGQAAAMREALSSVLVRAGELTSWDWPRLLIDGHDSDVAARDSDLLEQRLPAARAALATDAGRRYVEIAKAAERLVEAGPRGMTDNLWAALRSALEKS